MYTLSLGLEIAYTVREKEHGGFRGSNEGAGGSSEEGRASAKGADRSIEKALWGSAGAQHVGA